MQCFSSPQGNTCLLKHPEEGTRLPSSSREKAPAPPQTCLKLESHLSHTVKELSFTTFLMQLLMPRVSDANVPLSSSSPGDAAALLTGPSSTVQFPANPTYSAILRAGQHHTRILQKVCSKHISEVFLVLSTCHHKDQDCRSLLKKLETVKCTFEEFLSSSQEPNSPEFCPQNNLLTQAHTPAPMCSALI